MLSLVNLTPHPITLRTPQGDVTIVPDGTVARVMQTPSTASAVAGLPVMVLPSPVFGPVNGLPAPAEGVAFIVSGLVLAHCKGRTDVFAPATGPGDGAIRNEAGHIIAVTALVAAP